jgi:hypothetical protein
MYTFDVWQLGSVLWAVYVFMNFDTFYNQWHRLAKKYLGNKVYMIMIMKLRIEHCFELVTMGIFETVKIRT